MTQFATVDDYEARYGEAEDPDRISVLLGDASVFIESQPGFVLNPDSEVQALALTIVTCSIVHRSQSAGAWAGLSNVSQGGDGYTASATVYNPSGDFYLTKQEKRLLGVGTGRIGSVAPVIDGRYGSNAGDEQ